MAFEFPNPYSPFSHTGLSMCMGDNQALMYEQMPPHIYDLIPPHGMSPPGPNNGSPANLPPGERTETKPRLHKDEVARLEKIFLDNHKPNSNTKRGLADQMGVEVARINNWFQNRRAKAKQEKKQDEFEQRRKLAEATSHEEQSYNQQEAFSESFDMEAQSHGSFPSSNGPRTASIVSCQPQYDDPTAASLDSFDRTMEAARAAVVGTYMSEHGDLSPTPRMSLSENCMDDSISGDRVRFPSSDGWSGNIFTDPFSIQAQPIQFQAEVEPPMNSDSLAPFDDFAECNEMNGVNPLVDNNNHNSLLPSQLLSPNLNQTNSQAQEDFVRHFEQPEFPKEESNDEQCQSQPDGMLRFRAPPSSANIAARRRGVRPAALGTTPRSNSYIGPRTATHSPTVNRATVKPLSPMRRIVSVSNLHSSYGNVNGSRVQKSYPTSAQRSPINLKGFSDPESFFQSNAVTSKRPSLPASVTSNVNPLTPMSPREMLDLQREMTTSSNSSSPDETGHLYDPSTYFVSEYGESKMASPPETPAFYAESHQGNNWASYNIPDEPLHTPGNMGFSSDIYSPWNLSQPNTPGLSTYQQPARFGYGYVNPQYGLQTSASSSNENLYPEGNQYPGFIKSSPPSNKELQFENHTAKDYEECMAK